MQNLTHFVRQRITRFIAYVLLGLWAVFTIAAIGWVVMASFKSNRELFQQPLQLPETITLENYDTAVNATNMPRYAFNSAIIIPVSVLGILVLSAPAAYALTRIKFRGANLITLFFIAGIGIPFPLVFIPLFAMMSRVGLVNNMLGLILIYVALSLPFSIFILTGFFVTLPKELEESARIDGCNDFQVFYRVMLPLASPGMLTVAIFNFIALWNEFQLALVFANTESTRPLSLGLYALRNALQYTGDWTALFAGVVLVMVPTIIVFVFLSDRMVSGITMGSGK
jgi:N-acetylglucosamine transport system permease protein